MELNTVLSLDLLPFFEYIRTIRYGYMDSRGSLHFPDDPDFSVEDYVFSSPEEVVRNNCGWCWDAANLIVAYCARHGIEHFSVFMEYRSDELHQTHTQVFLKHQNIWYPAPDNSSDDSFGAGKDSDPIRCRERFLDTFRAFLRHVLGSQYDETRLLVRTFREAVPAGIGDETYLALMRGKTDILGTCTDPETHVQ